MKRPERSRRSWTRSVRRLSGNGVNKQQPGSVRKKPRCVKPLKNGCVVRQMSLNVNNKRSGASRGVEEASPGNGYAASVRIDGGKGRDKRHEFTLRWSAQ